MNAPSSGTPGAPPPRDARPLVSVVIATRNRERYLGEALASLAAQTYPRLEILAVNDGSADGTARMLAEFASAHPSARVIETAGLGPGGARARAFEEARGTLFALQDDDDLSHPRRIERQVEHLLARPGIALLGTAAEMIDAAGQVLGRYAVPFGEAAIRRRLRLTPPFVHGSIVMRRECYLAAGGYRAVFPVAEDFDFYLRLPRDAGLDNLDEPLYRWRRHGGNTLERHEGDHFFFVAAARAFADERRERGSDSAALLAECGDREEFLARYPGSGRLLAYLGEAYARVGRSGEAWRHLSRALSRPGARARAAAWTGLAPALAVARRLRRGVTRGGLVVPEPGR
jgi:glycosyltransferase involved in cell wall biosynthesis